MLKINGLDTYYGESKIIDNLSLEVPKGKIVCLIGRNGVGKSTTLKSIMGLTKTPKGSIMFDGKEIIKMKPLDKQLTMCFYNLNLTFVAVLSSATERNYYDFLQQASKIHLAKRYYSAASSDSWQHSHLASDTFRFLVWLRDRLVFPACNHC